MSTPAECFRFHVFASVRHIVEQLAISFGSVDAVVEQFPFLSGYLEQMRTAETPVGSGPLDALRDAAGLDAPSVMLLLAAGLVDEDARFGFVFEPFQSPPGQTRPTLGLLEAWWRGADDEGQSVRARLRRLVQLGLLEVRNPDAPRLEHVVEPALALWDALRGEVHDVPAPGMRYHPPDALLSLPELVLNAEQRDKLEHLPALLHDGAVGAVVVRGPGHNGRRTVVGALARALDRGLLEVRRPDAWVAAGPLATLLHAVPVLVLDLGPGESAEVAAPPAFVGPLAVVLNTHGGLSGNGVERAIEVQLDIPNAAERAEHWRRSLTPAELPDTSALAERFRMTGGNIRKAAGLARAETILDGRSMVSLVDVQHASRALNRQALDTLATRLPSEGDWSQLVVDAVTRGELRRLEARCRHRERLAGAVGSALTPQLGPGIRALFSGPSGTGKTLAARLLAASLQLDVYRLDLAALVNKYIGQTEKNLDRVFHRAEELGVVLLLDEGDALLTQRTSVSSSNDRYANLETNYLLQRLESFQGILLVTSNASQRIDSAFQRRLDVVIEFRPPESAERLAIWRLCLPAAHAVEASLLEDVARRCALSGAAIRNAVVHAALLALDDGACITSEHVMAAVQREYRKLGAVCPLRQLTAA